MAKPTGAKCAEVAVASLSKGFTYKQHDCQDYLEWVVKQAGGKMAYDGTNAMARAAHKAGALWTLAEAKKQGKLVKGTFVFIHEASGEPSKYKADGLGNFSHVGMYVGENAVTDTDKNGKSRKCNVMHSSATMGRVAGSTTANGFTHVGWMPQINYGTDIDAPTKQDELKEEITMLYQAQVTGTELAVRKQPKKDASNVVARIKKGSTVDVFEEKGDWLRIQHGNVSGWVMKKFTKKIDEPNPIAGLNETQKEDLRAEIGKLKELVAEHDRLISLIQQSMNNLQGD